jgi:glycosyltransferase involved in cell wall biosynthesis
MEGRMTNLISWMKEANSEAFQIIVVCNSSTDDTYSELLNIKLQNRMDNLQIILSDASAAGIAREHGLQFANSEFIIFWDSDDYGKVGQLKKVLGAISENSEMIVCAYEVKNDASAEKSFPRTLKEDVHSKMLALACNPGLWRIIFRTDFVKKCKFGSSNMGEDQVFVAEVLSLDPVIEFTDSVIYEYHIGVEGQLTSKSEFIEGISISLNEICDLVRRPKIANLEIISIQFLSQASTLLRKGSIRGKFNTVKYILKFFFQGMKTDTHFRKKIIKKLYALKKILTNVQK